MGAILTLLVVSIQIALLILMIFMIIRLVQGVERIADKQEQPPSNLPPVE